MRALILTLALAGLSAASTAARAQDAPSHWGPVGLAITVHTSLPLGSLSQDVHGHVGFGLGVHVPLQISGHQVLRPSFEWTGFRINDRNLGARAFASMFDADYAEDRLVLRSYKLGLDYLFFQGPDGVGPYLILSGGVQRSRLYLEQRTVTNSDGSGDQQVDPIATWEPADTAWFGGGIGYQAASGVLMECRYANWRYRAEPGIPLDNTWPGTTHVLREAHSLTFAVGGRF